MRGKYERKRVNRETKPFREAYEAAANELSAAKRSRAKDREQRMMLAADAMNKAKHALESITGRR